MSYDAYQRLKEYIYEKGLEKEFQGKFVAYADNQIVCLTDDLERLRSIRLLNHDRIVYFEIGKDVMHEL